MERTKALVAIASLSLNGSFEPTPPNKVPAQFHIAPMQCYTNQPLRKLFHFLSPSSVKWTEMEKVDDIFPKTKSDDYLLKALEKRLGSPQSYDEASNLVLQLGTNNPDRLRLCVEHTVKRYEFKEINLNCGCPAIESGGAATYGASLMKDPQLTRNLVDSVRKGLEDGTDTAVFVRADISVKCRIGVFDDFEDMRPLDDKDYKYLKNYITNIHDAGANHVVLHARPAILAGLSPVKNRIVPELDYEFVNNIASDFKGKVDITLNGGITNFSQLQRLQEESTTTAVSSHMAGRWSLRRPLDLVGVEELLNGKQLGSSPLIARKDSVKTAIEDYVDYSVQMASLPSREQRFTTAELCLPLYLVVEQLRDDYHLQEENNELEELPLLSYDEIESLYDIVQDGVAQLEDVCNSGKKKKNNSNSDDVNFKRLSSSFKSMVGTKLANKWKRNRAEL